MADESAKSAGKATISKEEQMKRLRQSLSSLKTKSGQPSKVDPQELAKRELAEEKRQQAINKKPSFFALHKQRYEERKARAGGRGQEAMPSFQQMPPAMDSGGADLSDFGIGVDDDKSTPSLSDLMKDDSSSEESDLGGLEALAGETKKKKDNEKKE